MNNTLNNYTLSKSWNQELFSTEMQKEYITHLKAFLAKERETFNVFPAKELVFHAYDITPPDSVKVIIVGQDPYYNKDVADGLAFSCGKKNFIPPSLEVILEEAYSNEGFSFKKDKRSFYKLDEWAEQGVLLLNRILTVREGKAKSHEKKGWEKLTEKTIQILSFDSKPKVFMLWGSDALKLAPLIDATKHLVLKAPHPAAHLYNVRANSAFPGCKHFSKANNFLKSKGLAPINWILS